MGAWGTYPKDSDGSLDLFGEISDLVNNNFEKIASKYKNGYDYAGGVMLLLQKGFHVDRKIVQKAKKEVEKKLANERLSAYPKLIKSMNEVINGFEDLLSSSKDKKITAPLHWLERKGDRIKKNWSGLGFVD